MNGVIISHIIKIYPLKLFAYFGFGTKIVKPSYKLADMMKSAMRREIHKM
jgi:hypothetical protein